MWIAMSTFILESIILCSKLLNLVLFLFTVIQRTSTGVLQKGLQVSMSSTNQLANQNT